MFTCRRIRLIDKWRAGYIERCTSGLGGGIAETARESGYGAAVPTLCPRSYWQCR
nr:MAG TPA: hypothetical protein [Caudoviricetes sp.]